jgi:transposase-like protein
MNKIERFIPWLCSKFNRNELIAIITGLIYILEDRDPEIKPRDHFKEQHPHYREYYVDPLPPLTLPPDPKTPLTLDYRALLEQYRIAHGKSIAPIRRRGKEPFSKGVTCYHCGAPREYLYLNNGTCATQVRCKICNNLSEITLRHRKPTAKYWCPYCGWAMFRWKQIEFATVYKCGNDTCPAYLKALDALNPRETQLRKSRASQFKLRYQYREYHFTRAHLSPAQPNPPPIDLARAFNPDNIVGLVLTFHVSFGLSARKTATVMKQVFNIPISYQTVLNYTEAAASHCHRFNFTYKGRVDDHHAADETYIKIAGKRAYAFLAISATSHKISAYHVADNRDVIPATITMQETIRTATPQQTITLVTDGNPAYPAGIHFLNANNEGTPLTHRKVIGLQNLDDESELYRPFKQIIERLNRTYKYHTRAACGFKSPNGAIALTTLFVTHYNFLRPHYSLSYRTPIHMAELDQIPTIQAKWCRILDIAMKTT